jgi:large subunit ribosomal protein L1
MSRKPGKRYRQCLEKVPKGKVSVAEAVEIIKGFAPTKFDSTVELAVHLGIDPRQAEQALRGSISLSHGIGRSRKVIAFCEGDGVKAAKDAGAIEAGLDDLIDKIQKGWTDFDVAVASPRVMKSVSKLGRVLGPQGKMPSPKSGTVVDDVPKAVREYSAGKVEYRNDDGGNLHVPIGKVSFEARQLIENIEEFIGHVKRLRPTTAKGTYIKKVALSATMSPAVRIDVQSGGHHEGEV